VKARVEEMAAGYADPSQVVSYYYSNPEQLQQIEMAVLEDQVVDHILEQAAVETVSTNYQEALTGAAIAPPPEEGSEDDADPEVEATAEDTSEADDKS
jgi:FKBP-type peptidyl-prolyl cis-trans isomerase (trigger factor)